MTRRAVMFALAPVVACAVVLPIAGMYEFQTGDPYRGGRLYDKWWKELDIQPPAGDHPLYPDIGSRSGPDTWRCKECHGWDYKGRDGAYGSGSHYTGIRGVYGSTKSAQEIFDLLKRDDIQNGHGFGNYGMSDADIWDVVEFLQTLVVDTDTMIDPNGIFLGDEMRGMHNYTQGHSLHCVDCHGPEGNDINFGDPDNPEWIGTIAVENPWELQHKVRVGNPGTFMPSWIQDGGDNQGVADIGRYAQLNFPVGPLDVMYPQDVTMVKGFIVEGDASNLQGADDVYLRARSGFGRTLVEAHVMEMIVGTTTTVHDATEMIIAVESFVSDRSGTADVRLRNWSTNQFDSVLTFAVAQNEDRNIVLGVDPTDYVRPSDGRIEVSLKYVVPAPFFSFLFDTYVDEVKMLLE